MQLELTVQQKSLIPPRGQQILADVDAYIARVATLGKKAARVVLNDADFIYLVNCLQSLYKRSQICADIDYQGIKLVRCRPY
ncbi:MAG: hypothetical protein U1F68_12230 [Gammaproteobacteria bacterium]